MILRRLKIKFGEPFAEMAKFWSSKTLGYHLKTCIWVKFLHISKLRFWIVLLNLSAICKVTFWECSWLEIQSQTQIIFCKFYHLTTLNRVSSYYTPGIDWTTCQKRCLKSLPLLLLLNQLLFITLGLSFGQLSPPNTTLRQGPLSQNLSED